MVQLYKHEAYSLNESSMQQGEKRRLGNDSNISKLCHCTIHRRAVDGKSVFTVPMKVTAPSSVDISNPTEEKPQATVGFVKLSSRAIFEQRQWLESTLGHKPYSEVLYSHATSRGCSLSLEQLFASNYSTWASAVLSAQFAQERRPIILSLLSILEDEESQYSIETQGSSASLNAGEDSTDAQISSRHELVLESLDLVDDMIYNVLQHLEEIRDHSQSVLRGGDVESRVIPVEAGGCHLRRSIWKKSDLWQFTTVNLNIHLMSSEIFGFSEICSGSKASSSASEKRLHLVPTITLGCPAAHRLKYNDGGLRRIFQNISTDLHKLIWMQALQSPYVAETLRILFGLYPREASALFGSSINIATTTGVAALTYRKFELSLRIDSCASQALGFALTSIRTICMLAARRDPHSMDVLARSLKIGFFLCLQSMLSTQGDELGMIEDLDMAALWLHLVSIRLVVRNAAEAEGTEGSSRQLNDVRIRRDVVRFCFSHQHKFLLKKKFFFPSH